MKFSQMGGIFLKKKMILGIILLISLSLIESVLAASFNSVTSDKTAYKNGDTITVTADLDAAGYGVYGDFSTIEDSDYSLYEYSSDSYSSWISKERYNEDFSVKLSVNGSMSNYASAGLLPDAINIPLDNIANISFYYKIANDAVKITSVDLVSTWPMYFRMGTSFSQGYFSPYVILDLSDGTNTAQLISQQYAEETKVDWTKWDSSDDSLIHTEALFHNGFTIDPAMGGSVPAFWGELAKWKTIYPGYNITKVKLGMGFFDIAESEFQSAYVDYLRIDDSSVIINEPNNLKKGTDNGNTTYTIQYPIATAKAEGTANIPVTAEVTAEDSVTNNSLSIIIDNTVPTVVLSDNHADAIVRDADTVVITATFTEANSLSGTPKITIGSVVTSIDMTATVDPLVWTYTWNVPAGNDGNAAVSITAADVAGNANQAATGETSYTIDNTAPTVAITSTETTPTKASPIPMTVTFSQDVTGFVVGDIIIGNGAASNFISVNGSIYTFDVTPTIDGAVTANIASGVAQDIAGNDNTAATLFSITYDGTAPTIDAGTDKLTNAQVSQNASASDTSGIASYAWTKESGAGTITFGAANAQDTTIEADTDDTYTIRLTVTDNAGNSAYDEITFEWDSTAPQITTLGNGRDTDPVYNDDDVILSATVTDPNIDYVYVEGNWEGVLTNYSADNGGGSSYTYMINAADLENQENIVYKWYAGDVLGQTSESIEYSFAVQNRAPSLSIASPISIDEDSYNEVDLTGTDPDGDVLIYTKDSISLTGKINIDITGNVMNISAIEQDWSGTVTFDLFVRDPYFQISFQQITVNVVAVNDVPAISGITTQQVNEDTGPYYLNLSQYTTDVDTADPNTFTYTATPEDAAKVNCAIENEYNISYTLAGNYTGLTYCNLTANDGSDTSTVYQLGINVANVNDAPTITSTPVLNAAQSGTYLYDVNAIDIDGETPTYLLSTYPSGMSIDAATGIITWQPTNAQALAQTANVVVAASDGKGGSATQSFTITISNVNDAPVIHSTAVTIATQDIAYTYALNATDADNNDLSYNLTTAPSGMSVNSNGVIGWTPNNAQVGSNSVVVEVKDGNGGAATQSFIVVVSNVNDVPVINSVAVTSAKQGEPYSYPINAIDADNDVLSYSLTTKPSGMGINPLTGLIGWIPTNAQVGSNSVVVEVKDGNNGVATQSFTITVTNVNDLPTMPTLLSPADATTLYTDSVTLNWTASTDDDNNPVTYYVYFSNETSPSFKQSTTNTQLTVSSLQHGYTYYWYVIAGDATGNQTKTATRSFTVSLKNAPVISAFSPSANPALMEGSSQLFSITATDIDSEDTLTYSWKLNGTEVSATNSYTFSPSFTQSGTYTLTATVTDSFSLTASKTWTITITDNTQPEITSYSPLFDPAIKTGQSQLFNVAVEDPDNSLTYAWKVNGAQVGTNSNSYTYTAAALGTYNISVSITDGEFTLSKEWQLTVSNIPVSTEFTAGTTNFSSITDLSQATNIVLAKQQNKIDFGNATLDLSNAIDLNNNIIIQGNFVGINTNNLPALNKPATITMNINLNQPVIYYNNGFTTNANDFTQVCDFCVITSYNKDTGELVFTAEHFTTFMPGEEKLELDIADLEVRVDSNTDKTVTSGAVISKEASPGSTVKVKIKVANQFEEEMRIENIFVEATLLGIDDGEDLDEESEEFDLREGRDKTITLTFDVPNKVDEDTYDLDIYIEGEDENGTTHTVEWTIYLDVEKKNHNLEIENLELKPNKISCVRDTKLNFEIVNYGRDTEEEVAYSIFNEELGIDNRQGYFELSEDLFSDDSKLIKSIPIKVSADFANGTYPITVKAFYNKDNLDVTKTVEMIIEDCEVKAEKVQEKTEAKPEEIKKETTAVKEKTEKEVEISFRETPEYMALLIGGIVILFVLVIFAFIVMVKNSRRSF